MPSSEISSSASLCESSPDGRQCGLEVRLDMKIGRQATGADRVGDVVLQIAEHEGSRGTVQAAMERNQFSQNGTRHEIHVEHTDDDFAAAELVNEGKQLATQRLNVVLVREPGDG